MRRALAVLVALSALPIAATAQDARTEPPPQARPIVRAITITGNHELPDADVIRAGRLHLREPLPDDLDHIAARIERHYRDAGYTFAHVTASLDEPSGAVSIAVSEGVIDRIEFEGVDDRIAATFANDFAVHSGDVFNRPRATSALDALLQRTRGAVRRTKETFDLVDRAGERVLIVDLREPAGRFRLVPDLGAREDWFTSVDGFVPSLGFGAAVFDHESFNHAFVAGHLSVKTATGTVGYALGFERPFFARRRLFVGAELRDLTATDDQWQITATEASLAAIGPRLSYRDYYRQRGVQVQAALRVRPSAELFVAYRHERHEPLAVESDFSVWNSDDAFRPNRRAVDGHLSSLIVGAAVDSAGFERESLEATYQRHQLASLFGERLRAPAHDSDASALWRVDWTSEISSPDALQSDFDFTRHVVAGRADVPLSPHQDFSIRAIGGWSTGVLPPQRQFSAGGIGSVHGYEFKEQIGDSLTLLNLEYSLGDRTGLRVIGFFDTGRAPLRQASAATPWLNGVGFGVGMGVVRLDFGYKLDAIPSSFQFLLRFVRTF